MNTLLALLVLGTTIYLPFVPFAPETKTNKLGLSGASALGQQTLGATWAYSWTNLMPTEGVREAVPMIRGAFDPAHVPEVTGSSRWIMGANEPDLQGQADVSAERYAGFLVTGGPA